MLHFDGKFYTCKKSFDERTFEAKIFWAGSAGRIKIEPAPPFRPMTHEEFGATRIPSALQQSSSLQMKNQSSCACGDLSQNLKISPRTWWRLFCGTRLRSPSQVCSCRNSKKFD